MSGPDKTTPSSDTNTDGPYQDPFTLITWSWPVRISVLAIAGMTVARLFDFGPTLFIFGVVLATLALFFRFRNHAPHFRVVAMCAVFSLSGAWLHLQLRHTVPNDLSRYVIEGTPQLARVTGTVREPVRLAAPHTGPFARFSYQIAATFFELDTDTIEIDGKQTPTRGLLFIRINNAEHRLRPGDRIAATGWLTAPRRPSNPGDKDYYLASQERGIVGRLTLKSNENWQKIGTAKIYPWHIIRRKAQTLAQEALALGLDDNTTAHAFLETILLGRRSLSNQGTIADNAENLGEDYGSLREDFKNTGLAHLLSISGAHLGILMGLAWLLFRLIFPHPPRAAAAVLALLLLYMIIVPWRVPVVRAAIMVSLFCFIEVTGRRARAIDVLAVAMLIVLAWRPLDLFTAGFQLSFGVVAALLLYSQTWIERFTPPAILIEHQHGLGTFLTKLAIQFFTVSFVAWVAAVPIVAYHFEIVTPLSLILTPLAIPFITATLGLGYLKIVGGIVLPSFGLILAPPLTLAADATALFINHAADWPGSTFFLQHNPGIPWTLAAVGVAIAVLSRSTHFYRRPYFLTLAVALIVASFIAIQHPDRFQFHRSRPRLTLDMLAVGDGSCFLVRTPSQTVMVDAGSYQLMNIGRDSIVPTLRKLGINHLDRLILTHADLDHFSATIYLLEYVTIDEVWMPHAMIQQGTDNPDSATGVLFKALNQNNILVSPVEAGHRDTWDDTAVEVLWPPSPEVFSPKRNNDGSIVLALFVAGRRVLLTGDIQSAAINELLKHAHPKDTHPQSQSPPINLNADVADLPHHGAFIEESPAWLAALTPQYVLQSGSDWRLRQDPWPPHLAELGIQRFTTPEHGMTSIAIFPDGKITTQTFKQNKRKEAPTSRLTD